MSAEYAFPDGTVLQSGIAIFERVLATQETATATESATGSHAGAVITFAHVKHLLSNNWRDAQQFQMQADIQKHQATLIAAQMRGGNG